MVTNRSKVTYSARRPSATLDQVMSYSYAYLSQGQLHLKLGNDPIRPIDSKFGEAVRARAAQIHSRNSWKTQGTGAKFMSGGVLWGRQPGDPTDIHVDI